MIDFTTHLTLRDGLHADTMESLQCLLERTRVLPGCDRCDLMQDSLDPQRIMLRERWTDEAALIRHLRSRDFRAVLAAVDLSAEHPEVRFDWVSRSEDLGFVRAICATPDQRESCQ